jgi:hypothetical protein
MSAFLFKIMNKTLDIKKYKKEWFQKNKQKIYEQKRKNYADNKNGVRLKRLEEYKINKERYKEYSKKWCIKNKDKVKEYSHNYFKKNKEVIINKNSKYHKIWQKDKLNSDSLYRLVRNMQNRFSTVTKKREVETVSNAVKNYLGCSKKEFKLYIESKFKDGMNSNNYGIGGWTVDHILPYSRFDINNDDDLSILLHYSNIQPLWMLENINKGNKIDL